MLRIFFASVELSCWPWDHIEPCSLLWVSPATCPSLQPPCFDFITLHACHPAVFGLFDFIMMGWMFSLSLAQKQAGLRSLSAPRAPQLLLQAQPRPLRYQRRISTRFHQGHNPHALGVTLLPFKLSQADWTRVCPLTLQLISGLMSIQLLQTGQQTFHKGQIVNISDFAGQTVSVTTT